MEDMRITCVMVGEVRAEVRMVLVPRRAVVIMGLGSRDVRVTGVARWRIMETSGDG
jgi:hypothetical protein